MVEGATDGAAPRNYDLNDGQLLQTNLTTAEGTAVGALQLWPELDSSRDAMRSSYYLLLQDSGTVLAMEKRAIYSSLMIIAALTVSGCMSVEEITDDGDSFQDRQNAIQAVYEQGKESRKTMEKTGVIVDEKSCTSAWSTSGALTEDTPKGTTRKDNDYFQQIRQLSFINGCMDRPNSLPAVTAPALKPASAPAPSNS